MDILLEITGVIVAYLIGSIATAVWIGKKFYHIDIRTVGSKNAGATNTIRVLGLKPGLIVFVIDMLKGFTAVSLGNFFGRNLTPDILIYYKILLGVCAVIGHIFPVFAGFRGGKGIATTTGVLIALFLNILPVVLGIFILVFCVWKYISLASVVTSICFPIVYIFSFVYCGNAFHLPLMIFACLVAIFVPITHRKNIKRLLAGTETKFKFRKTVE